MSGTELRECHPFRSAKARDRYLGYYDARAKSWPIASETRTVSTGYGTTFMRVSGPSDGPAFVLLPGGQCNSLCWAPMIEAFSEKYRTYALDAIYDVGRSVNSRPVKTMVDVTGWLDGVLDALGLCDGVSMMGLSFGGYSTAKYVLHAPQRLRKAVWLSPAGVALPLSGGFMLRSMQCLIPSRVTFGAFSRWIMPDLASDKLAFDDAVDDMVLATRCYGLKAWPGGGPRALTDAELGGIKVPVLYVVGERERVCSDAHAAVARINTLAPQIETVILPGAGHDLFMLQPAAVSHRVLRFLGE